MSTKDELLNVLNKSKGKYLSGEELATQLNVSRTAIWKAIKQLQSDGFEIDAVTNKGYSLAKDTDIVTIDGIKEYLNDESKKLDINVVSCVGSTNTILKELNINETKDGYVLIANEQTAGRGRRGRSFFSPKGTGVYMSILLKPERFVADKAIKITTMAASAMCKAITTVSDVEPRIKWVNDIFVNGKKTCGILTEASFDLETGFLDYAILGIGVNMYMPKEGFPDDIKDIAGSVFNEKVDGLKNKLLANFINYFMEYYHSTNNSKYISIYKEYSLAIGRNVNVICNGNVRKAFVDGIDDECRLLVTFEDGSKDVLSYGEISIKL